jgi:hypothetical protein
MQRDVGEVIAGRLQSVELEVDLVRDPGERDPVRLVARRERADRALEREPGAQIRILYDADVVVEDDELVILDLEIDQEHRREERREDGPPPSRVAHASPRTLRMPSSEMGCSSLILAEPVWQ